MIDEARCNTYDLWPFKAGITLIRMTVTNGDTRAGCSMPILIHSEDN